MSVSKTIARPPNSRTPHSPAKPSAPMSRSDKLNVVGVTLDDWKIAKYAALSHEKCNEVHNTIMTAVFEGKPEVALDLAPEDLPVLTPIIACRSIHAQPEEPVGPEPLPLPPADSKDSPELSAMFPIEVRLPPLVASPDLKLSASGQVMMGTIKAVFAPFAHMQPVAPAARRLKHVFSDMMHGIGMQPASDRPALLRQLGLCLDGLQGPILHTPAAKFALFKFAVAATATGEGAVKFKEKNARALQTYTRHLDTQEPDFNPGLFSSKLSAFIRIQSGQIAGHQPASERLALLAHLVDCLDGIAQDFPDQRPNILRLIAIDVQAARHSIAKQETQNPRLDTAFEAVMQMFIDEHQAP